MTPRIEALERLRDGTTWDLVIIGGGATGLGTAVDAATRGYRTLLLEAHDFAQATSSRSTKLIHGGVRYLATGQIGLVREALHERGRLLRNAPHLVRDRAFLVPAYRWWERSYYSIGLGLYDLLAGGHSLGRSRGVPREVAETLAPALRRDGLRGGVVYHDAQFDDARLAVTLARTADDHGATMLNRVAVEGLTKATDGRVRGVVARDVETGESFNISARVVVNATGVFTDAIRRLDDADAAPVVQPSQGAHLVFDRALFPGDTAVLIPKTDDGRVLFLIPWHDRVLVGTTDTPVPVALMEPKPLAEELAFLLDHAGRYLTRAPVASDVRSAYAGLRPLVMPRGGEVVASKKVSREHTVLVSKAGLVTITGGKWTTYRAMAESAVDLAANVAGLPARSCATAELHLHGWTDAVDVDRFRIYGSDASGLRRLVAEHPEWDVSLHPRLGAVAAEVVWAARHEAARTVEDVLARRTRSLFLDARASIEAAPRVAELLAVELGRDAAWVALQIAEFQALAAGYLIPG
jgi:glycerol-3-phosphate dehydrogenase